jgi:hypothetical protein
MAYFQFEARISDGNDVSVAEFYVKADGEKVAWDIIENRMRSVLNDKIQHEDGDEESLVLFYDADDQCKSDKECDNERCNKDHRTFSVEFRLIAKDLEDKPECALSYWHGWVGPFNLQCA